MIEMGCPRADETERQKQLWKESFGDSREGIDYYYENHYRAEQTFVLREEGELCSMLTGLPAVLTLPSGARLSGAYVYAVATAAQMRGNGFGGFLLKYADHRFREQGLAFAALVPAQESLFRFFSRADYRAAFSTRELSMDRTQLPAAGGAVIPAQAAQYNEVRKQLLAGYPHMAYDEEGIRMQQGFSRLSGADLYLLELPEGTGCAAVERLPGEQVLVKELLCPEGDARAGLGLLAGAVPGMRYTARVPAWYPALPDSATRPFGMIKWYQDAPEELQSPSGWLGLAYD